MSILVIAEHDNASLKAATLNAVTAAVKIGGDISQYSSRMPPVTIGPDDVGEMVANAIERDAAFIVTHKQVLPGIEERFDAIREACEYRLAH